MVRIAEQLGVGVNEWERAQILGQIAALLASHPRIGKLLAYKGGAIMHLVDGSPRLSGDLDGVVVSGRPLRETMLRDALQTADARRIVLRVGDITNPSPHSLDMPFIVCRSLSGRGNVTIRLQISWRERPLETPTTETITIEATGASRTLPVLTRAERAAEKVRSFLERGLARDAFDLYHYAGLDGLGSSARLARLIRRKLREGDLPVGIDLHARFEEMLASARDGWGRRADMILVAQAPDWPTVERILRARFKALVPPKRRST